MTPVVHIACVLVAQVILAGLAAFPIAVAVVWARERIRRDR